MPLVFPISNSFMVKKQLETFRIFSASLSKGSTFVTVSLYTVTLVCNSKSFIGTNHYYASKKFRPPVDLYLISEKSIWKNQVRQTGFLVYFELDFYCLCSLQKSILKLNFLKIFICKILDYQKAYQTTWRCISMDHKTAFKMTLGQNEKFCWPF